jgi:hypothetical protein
VRLSIVVEVMDLRNRTPAQMAHAGALSVVLAEN